MGTTGLCALGLRFDEPAILRCMQKTMGDLDAASWERIISVQVHYREELLYILNLYEHPEEDEARMEEERKKKEEDETGKEMQAEKSAADRKKEIEQEKQE